MCEHHSCLHVSITNRGQTTSEAFHINLNGHRAEHFSVSRAGLFAWADFSPHAQQRQTGETRSLCSDLAWLGFARLKSQ